MFREIVGDVYDQRYKEIKLVHDKYKEERQKTETKLEKLKDLLEDGVYSKDDYEKRRAKVEAQLIGMKIPEIETFIDFSEMETCVNYISNFLESLPILWMKLTSKEKYKFHQILFPKGVILENAEARTPALHKIFKTIEDVVNVEVDYGDPYGRN